MNLPPPGGRRPNAIIPVVVALILFSTLAAPFQPSRAAVQTGGQQVVPTVLSGFRQVGPLAGSTPVLVTVGIPLKNLETLQYLTQQISMPGSPLYRHFLTPSQVQAYLPSSQYNSALDYITAQGLKVVSTSLDSIIVAEGTASQVAQALDLHYVTYTNGSSTYYTSEGVSPVPGAYVYSSNVTEVMLNHPPDLVKASTVPARGASSPSYANQTEPEEGYPLTDLPIAYNATGLYAAGDKGAGYTVGVLDFYGDPYMSQQLAYFDEAYGLPSSPFAIIPIGPYNPSLGVYTTWDTEISLDVESVHAMAPQAGIDLYIGNGELPIGAVIAEIVQQDKVNDVTQSFGYSEGMISQFGATALELNVIMADQYYMLGSAEGITFIASTGDSGASGFSGGPAGNPGYPATSPYDVAVGGTTTYLTFNGKIPASAYSTAWGSYGFVPFQQNYGGSTGGVSVLEPTPWYQSGIPIPSSFTSGRLTPDLSLNAAVTPAVEVILPGNVTALYGGTSESNQLFGGLLTLLMGASKSSFGLLNPTLYQWGGDSAVSSKIYIPTTFGYTIPWVASSGYNLVTGFGAPNIGEMARYLESPAPVALGINVSASVAGLAPEDLLPGQIISVAAGITSGHSGVTTGSFTAQLDTLAGDVASTPLTYQVSSQSWTGSLAVPNDAAGVAYITVSGTSGNTAGTGFFQTFAGYVATFLSPGLDSPDATQFGVPLELNVTTLGGAPVSGSFSVSASSYSIRTNTYTKVTSVPLTHSGFFYLGQISGKYPYGPMLLSGDGSLYGYLPMINGVSMQSSFIEPTVLAQPGVVGPGQTLYVLAELQAPDNTPEVVSQETGLSLTSNVEQGSNLTVALVSPTGETVARSTFYLNNFLSSLEAIQGGLNIPATVKPGLYDVIMNSSYYSPDISSWINGSYFGQVYVSSSLSTTTITVTPSTVYEGQSVQVNAKIDYANGTAVKYGMFQGTIYPNNLKSIYNVFNLYVSFPMWYNASTGLWSGDVTLPSAYNSGGTAQVDQGALYLSGPYDIFITGLSADGVPADTDITTQQPLQVQPYLYLGGSTVSSVPQSSGVVFSHDTITAPSQPDSPGLSLTSDLFTGSNTIQGNVSILDSQVQGTLVFENANVRLVGVTGGSIVASNSTIVLDQSSIASLRLINSHVSMNGSAVGSISPSLPVISVLSPIANSIYTGTSGSLTVGGDQLSSVSVFLDGTLLQTFAPSDSYTFSLDGPAMPVGGHVLKVVATQSDGLWSSASVYFSTNGPLMAANSSLGSLSTQLSSQVSSQNGKIDSLNSQLRSETDLIYALAGVAALALVVALVAVVRGRPSQSPRPPAETAARPPPEDPSPALSPAQGPPAPASQLFR